MGLVVNSWQICCKVCCEEATSGIWLESQFMQCWRDCVIEEAYCVVCGGLYADRPPDRRLQGTALCCLQGPRNKSALQNSVHIIPSAANPHLSQPISC